ncbi:RraA family protein [Inquilinus sp.]|uniref:RraA family protein n=1 Tax=Inquilinus sp. TaxID=1932117 RepID=UPI0031DE8B01
MTDLTARLEACYSGAVFDVLRDMGHANCVLPRTILAVDPDTRICGRIFTIRGRPDDTIDAHRSLLAWTELLTVVPKDHVAICQPQDDVRALMGELSAEALQSRGVRGYIVDGGSRDNAFIRRLGFPVFARFRTPRDIVAAWMPEAYGEPITIGQVRIATGDWVVADIDGIVVIPAALAEETVAKVEDVMRQENLVRRAILDGVSPQEAYLRHGKF